METHNSQVDNVKNSSTASNASLLQSMVQRLRKDESSRSLHLSSLGGSLAEENSLSGSDNDQETTSRKFNTQVLAKKQGNVAYSPTVIPKWERRQLFLHQCSLNTFGGFKQKSEEDHPPGERDELFGWNNKTSNTHPSNILSEIRGTVDSVIRENDDDTYEDVLPLLSMDEPPSQSTDEMQPDPSCVQTHNNTHISNLSCYRVKRLFPHFQTLKKNRLVTSTKTCTWSGDDQLLKTSINENQTTDPGMNREDVHRRCHTTQDPSLKRGETGSMGSNTSLGKVSEEWKNTADITETLSEKWREKSESRQDKESLYLEPDPPSLEEAMASSTNFYEEQGPSEIKTCLQRTFTLCDFKLDLGSMNLMDEVFTGDEWSKYLPLQKYPSQEEDTDLSLVRSVHKCIDNELSVTPNLDHHVLRPESSSGSVHSCENTDFQRSVIEGDQDDSGVESSTYIYAIKTEDVANSAEKNNNPSGYQEESGDIYDYVEYMIPMPSNWKSSKTTPFLDFSVIKSQQLLDNSMLKSRISLGKKRKHRPPGQRNKEKSNSTFYSIPSSVLQPPPQLLPSACSSSPSPSPAIFSSSVFYTHPLLTDSQENMLSQSLESVTEKSKPRWKGLFPKTKAKSKR